MSDQMIEIPVEYAVELHNLISMTMMGYENILKMDDYAMMEFSSQTLNIPMVQEMLAKLEGDRRDLIIDDEIKSMLLGIRGMFESKLTQMREVVKCLSPHIQTA